MDGFRLHDWNDVRLIIACAERGGFAGAASALGVDQTTVSRRIGELEKILGRPLFNRRRSGATPTVAGLALLERARAAQQAIGDFERMMGGLEALPAPTVTVAASEGLLTYTLIPVLLGSSATNQPVDTGLIRAPLPNLAFSTRMDGADIAVVATSRDAIPQVRGALRIRRIGTMHFRPVVGHARIKRTPAAFDSFQKLVRQPLLDIAIYRPIRSLDGWNGLVQERLDRQEVVLSPATPQMHKALVSGQGVGILPSYSSMYDEDIVVLDVPSPDMSAALWLVAHEDKLREPAVRSLYDTLAQLFLRSPWFRDGASGAG